MKKTILLALVIGSWLVQSAFATISITASPSSQNVTAGGTFNVTFSLSITQSSNPANLAGIDLFLEALLNQNSVGNISSLFSIQSQTVLLANWSAAGPANYPDTITSANSTHAGFVQNKEDQALSANNLGAVRTTPFVTTPFETLTLTINSATPAGVYNFATTAPTSATDGRGTHITNSSGAYFIPDSQATFSITVVPEPATFSFLVLAGIGAVGVSLRRRLGRA